MGSRQALEMGLLQWFKNQDTVTRYLAFKMAVEMLDINALKLIQKEMGKLV